MFHKIVNDVSYYFNIIFRLNYEVTILAISKKWTGQHRSGCGPRVFSIQSFVHGACVLPMRLPVEFHEA